MYSRDLEAFGDLLKAQIEKRSHLDDADKLLVNTMIALGLGFLDDIHRIADSLQIIAGQEDRV